jgi:zinc D-Ala-D-Ala carboxypeptidase
MTKPTAATVAPDTRLSPHFTVAEFTFSETAAREGIDNRLPLELQQDAVATALMLERIRAHLSTLAGRTVPIHITSGYRCWPLNSRVGSNSGDHPGAQAGDWVAPAFGTPQQICEALAPHVSRLGIGQLIHEYGRWVHTSRKVPSNPINRIITIDRFKGAVRVRAGVLQVA